MKILFCIRGLYNSGGMERILVDRVNYFIENFNYECMIVTLEQKNKESFYKLNSKAKINDLDINYSSYKNNNIFSKIIKFFVEQFKHKKRLKKIIKQYAPDVVISLGDNEKFILPKIYKGKLILEHHFEKYHRFKSQQGALFFIINYILLKREERLRKKYDEFLVLTREDKEQWKKIKTKVIPNFLYKYPERTSNLENKIVISVGRLEYQKGYDLLIEVWRKVKEQYPDWKLNIYGEGELREKLQEKINNYNLEKDIFLKGRDKNIQEKYLESSIYVMSSRYEGFGMVLIEAQASGLPIVAFECPCGPKDIITNKEDGYLCKVGDIEEMANRIICLIEDEEKRKKFGKKAMNNSFRFTEEKIMNQWKELLENLVIREEV